MEKMTQDMMIGGTELLKFNEQLRHVEKQKRARKEAFCATSSSNATKVQRYDEAMETACQMASDLRDICPEEAERVVIALQGFDPILEKPQADRSEKARTALAALKGQLLLESGVFSLRTSDLLSSWSPQEVMSGGFLARLAQLEEFFIVETL